MTERLGPALPVGPGTVVAVDYDGTLAPIVERPEDARPAPGALAALAALAARGAVVVLVSGRPATTLVELAALESAPGLEDLVVFGSYGAERWTRSTGVSAPAGAHPGVAALRARLPLVLARAPEGVRIEDKGMSLAVHTRQATEPIAALDALRPRLTALAVELGLVVQPGRLVIELRPPGPDKGTAVRTVVAERAAAALLYAGDDLGDLAAYDAAEALRANGLTVLLVAVDSPESPPALRDRADVVVDSPAALVTFLTDLAS